MNLIGEHTDYNGGLVLPTVISLRTTVAITGRDDALVRLRSESPGCAPVKALVTELRPTGTWADHVLGAVWALGTDGRALGGFDGMVRSDIPAGAGLASSAALSVATLRALRTAFALALDDRVIADLAHRAEVEFVGARVGRMDQLVCSLGRAGEALFMDMRSGASEAVRLDGLDADIAVIDSGIRHDHATGAYNTRREECAAAARTLGVATLRHVPVGLVLSHLPAMLARRVRHVTTENPRVEAAVIALRAGDASSAEVGRTVRATQLRRRRDHRGDGYDEERERGQAAGSESPPPRPLESVARDQFFPVRERARDRSAPLDLILASPLSSRSRAQTAMAAEA